MVVAAAFVVVGTAIATAAEAPPEAAAVELHWSSHVVAVVAIAKQKWQW